MSLCLIFDCITNFLDDYKNRAISSGLIEPLRFYYDALGDDCGVNHVNVHGVNWQLAIIEAGLGLGAPMSFAQDGCLMAFDDWVAGMRKGSVNTPCAQDDHVWSVFSDPKHFGASMEGLKHKLHSGAPDEHVSPSRINFRPVTPSQAWADAIRNTTAPASCAHRARFALTAERFAEFFKAPRLVERMLYSLNSELKPEHHGWRKACNVVFSKVFQKRKLDFHLAPRIESLNDQKISREQYLKKKQQQEEEHQDPKAEADVATTTTTAKNASAWKPAAVKYEDFDDWCFTNDDFVALDIDRCVMFFAFLGVFKPVTGPLMPGRTSSSSSQQQQQQQQSAGGGAAAAKQQQQQQQKQQQDADELITRIRWPSDAKQHFPQFSDPEDENATGMMMASGGGGGMYSSNVFKSFYMSSCSSGSGGSMSNSATASQNNNNKNNNSICPICAEIRDDIEQLPHAGADPTDSRYKNHRMCKSCLAKYMLTDNAAVCCFCREELVSEEFLETAQGIAKQLADVAGRGSGTETIGARLFEELQIIEMMHPQQRLLERLVLVVLKDPPCRRGVGCHGASIEASVARHGRDRLSPPRHRRVRPPPPARLLANSRAKQDRCSPPASSKSSRLSNPRLTLLSPSIRTTSVLSSIKASLPCSARLPADFRRKRTSRFASASPGARGPRLRN